MTSSATRLKNDRLALLPAAAHSDAAACLAALAEGRSAFLELVLVQDLGALWHHTLQSAGLLDSLPPATKEALREARMAAAMGYLAQRAALDELDRLFDSAGVRWVAIKGSHAFVAAGEAGMLVLDVSDPARPRHVSGYRTHNAIGITILGNLACIADGGWLTVAASHPQAQAAGAGGVDEAIGTHRVAAASGTLTECRRRGL